MDEDYSDKENHAPLTSDVHSPPPLPINSKCNIFAKQVAVETHYERQASLIKSPSNTARKRQKLGALSNTPPRPSYASQMSKIFAARPPPTHRPGNEVVTPPGIPEDAMKVFNHFKQALRCRPSRETITKPRGIEQDDNESSSSTDSTTSDGNGSEDDAIDCGHIKTGSGQSTVPLLKPEPSIADFDENHLNPSPSSTSLSSSEEDPLADLEAATARSWHSSSPSNITSPPTHLIRPLSIRPRPAASQDATPTSDLERAISAALPPTPSRQERRKTLNIDLKNPSLAPLPKANHSASSEPAPSPSSSSTESWTGDEIFFQRDQQHPSSYQQLQEQTSTLRQHSYPSTPSPPPPPPPSTFSPSSPSIASPPAIPLLSPLRALRPGGPRSSRFHVPVVKSPMGRGVPLCMESHPESGGSDADDEGDCEGMDVEG